MSKIDSCAKPGDYTNNWAFYGPKWDSVVSHHFEVGAEPVIMTVVGLAPDQCIKFEQVFGCGPGYVFVPYIKDGQLVSACSSDPTRLIADSGRYRMVLINGADNDPTKIQVFGRPQRVPAGYGEHPMPCNCEPPPDWTTNTGGTLIDGMLIRPTVSEGEIIASKLTNVVLGVDCGGDPILSGTALATCADLDRPAGGVLAGFYPNPTFNAAAVIGHTTGGGDITVGSVLLIPSDLTGITTQLAAHALQLGALDDRIDTEVAAIDARIDLLEQGKLLHVGPTTALSTLTVPAQFKMIETSGYATDGDGAGGLFHLVDVAPAAPLDRVFPLAGGRWAVFIGESVSPEQFGYMAGAPAVDNDAAMARAARVAQQLSLPLTAQSANYAISALRLDDFAFVERAGSATITTPRGTAEWATATAGRDTLSPPGYPSGVTVAEGVTYVTVADGSRWYDALPCAAMAPNGVIAAAFYRGTGHSPEPAHNIPLDPDWPATPENPDGRYGDVLVSITKDEGRTWSAPISVAGNREGGDKTWAYGQPIGVNHAGRFVLMTVQTDVHATDTFIYQQESADGIVWSEKRLMNIVGLNHVPAGRLIDPDKAGQFVGTGMRVFGGVKRLPQPGHLVLLVTDLGYAGSSRTRYLGVSYDDGATWFLRKMYSAADAVLPAHTLTEEGAIVPLSETEIVAFHRASANVSTIGMMSISRDQGTTWEWLGEAMLETLYEQTGGCLPQAAHTARIDGREWVIVHAGMRASGSNPASVQYGHYIVGCPTEYIMRGMTDKWEILRRIPHPSFTGLSTTEGNRDLYYGIVYDPVSGRFLAVTHDELVDNRHSRVVAYGGDLISTRTTQPITVSSVLTNALTLQGKVNTGAWLPLYDKYSAAHIAEAASGGLRLYDNDDVLVMEIGRVSSDGTVRFLNNLDAPKNVGFAFRGKNDAGAVINYALMDSKSLKPGVAGMIFYLTRTVGAPDNALAAPTSYATQAMVDTANSKLYIATGVGVWKSVTLV